MTMDYGFGERRPQRWQQVLFEVCRGITAATTAAAFFLLAAASELAPPVETVAQSYPVNDLVVPVLTATVVVIFGAAFVARKVVRRLSNRAVG